MARREPALREKAANDPNGVFVALSKLDLLGYAKVRKDKARQLGIPVATLDAEVKRHRPKDDERDFLPHWNVEPWPEEVDGAALLDEGTDFRSRAAFG